MLASVRRSLGGPSELYMKRTLISLAILIPFLSLSAVMAASSDYKVQAGDTLASIASKSRLSLRQLVEYNPQLVKVGEVLNLSIPVPVVTPPASSQASIPVATPLAAPKIVSSVIPVPVATKIVLSPGEVSLRGYTTSYTYWDNTPPGSSDISNPILHEKAGGTGTFNDPITIAVGHSMATGKDILDYPAGTKFYIPNVRRYFIVEDTCGDGKTPENGPCHKGAPAGTDVWVDMWIDGATGTSPQADACAAALTDTNGISHIMIKNPAPKYRVLVGPIFQNGSCTAQFGNTLVI